MLLAPDAHRGAVRRHRRDRLPAEQGVEHAGRRARHDERDRQPPQLGVGIQAVGEELTDRHHDQEERHRTGTLERVRDPAHEHRGDHARAGPREHRQGGRPQPAAVADLDQRRGERRHPDHPGTQDQRAARGGAEPRVREQLRVEEWCGDPALDEDERRERDDREHGKEHRGQVDPVAALGERADGQRHRGHQQGEPRDVHPVADHGRGLGHPPKARRDQHEGEDGRHPQTRPPPRAEVEERGQHRATQDAQTDRGSPDRRRPEPVRTQRVAVCERGQPAGEHRGSAATLDHPADHEQDRFDRDRAHDGADTGRDQAGDVQPPTSDGITDDARGEQQTGEPDAHRAEDPGAGDRTGAQIGRDRRDGRDRGHVGDQHQRGAEGHWDHRGAGVSARLGASRFEIQTHT